ncbi:hypothetical protein T01_11378, partial [Trichinella spiralis]
LIRNSVLESFTLNCLSVVEYMGSQVDVLPICMHTEISHQKLFSTGWIICLFQPMMHFGHRIC